LGRVLNLPPENVQMLVASLQQQHYLGERTEAGNYPIIPATIRQQRKFQAEMAAKVEKDQIAAMQQDTIETRAKANAAKKAAAAANQETQAEKEAAEAQREAAAALRFSRTGKASTIFPPTAWTTGGGGAGPEPFGLGSNAILNWQGGGGGPPVNMFGMPVPGFGGGGGGGGGGGRPGLFSFGRFASRFAGLTNFVAAAAIIYPIAQTIFSTIGAATQLQTELTRIQAIFGTKNLSDQLTIKQDVLNAARQLGEDVNQVAEAAQAFAQAGTSIANLGSNMQAAATGAKAFGTNIREVADYIIAVGESSRGKVGPNQAVDLLAAIGRRTNVSPLSIMQTIQNVNPLLEPFAPPIGAISNEALLGSIAGVVKQRTGVSNPEMALRFAISQLGNPQAAEKLQRISGIGFGTAESRGQDLRPFIEILGDLSRAYQHLIDTGRSAEAKELLRDFFGARQAVVGTTILQDWTKILKTARDAIGDTGAAANMAGPQVETFSSKFSKLKTTLTGFWGAFLEPAGDVLGFLDDILNHLVNINAQRAAAEQNRDPRSRSLYEMKMAAGETAGPPEPPSLTHFGLSTYDLLRGNLPGATAVPNTFGNIGPAFGMLRKQQNINELFNLEGTTPPQIIDYEQKRLQFEKLQADVTERLRAQTETWKLLGEGESHAKTELKEYSQLIQAYIAIPVYERTSENTKAFEEDMANYRTARAEVIREDLARNAITMERQRRLQDLRFTTAVGRIARKGVEETPEATLQEHINDILDTQRIKREEILFSYRDEIELLRDQAGPLLERDLEIADRKYNLAERGLSLESRQLIMEQQSNFLNEEKTKHLQKQREIQNELNKLTQQSLQGLIKGIEQERATGGKVRFGQLLTSQLLGPAAGYITGQIGANFDLFGEKGIFPGVGKFIQGAFGKAEYPVKPPTLESATREIQAERATQGIMSSGGGLSLAEASARRLAENVAKYKTAKEAFDKKQARDQAIVAAGMFGGQLIGAAEGGSETAINIGSTIGTLAGTPFGPPGMAVGALLGGVIGGLFGHRRPRPEIGHLQIIAENTREQVRLLENTNKLLETNFVSFNVPTGFRLPAYVPGSFGGVGGLRGASGGVVNSQIAVNVNIGGTNVAADKLGQTIAQAISDRLEFESRSSGGYFPRTLYG
jgi:TP901 family phage tail tape measure protein